MEQAEIVILCMELLMTVEHELPDLQPKVDPALSAEPACSGIGNTAIGNTYP